MNAPYAVDDIMYLAKYRDPIISDQWIVASPSDTVETVRADAEKYGDVAQISREYRVISVRMRDDATVVVHLQDFDDGNPVTIVLSEEKPN